jgi:PDZ domain-containing secreted protein
MDFKALTVQLDPARIIMHLNEIIETFDQIDEEYDVFKVETKADASYMVVAGLSDRSHIGSNEMAASTVNERTQITFAPVYSFDFQ